MTSILKVQQLVKKYKDLEAVKGVNFCLEQHECLAMLGKNGAGKSTTMKMIYSAIPITSGTITIDGLDVGKNPRDAKKILGIVSQEDLLDLSLTVIENLVAHAICYSIPLKLAKKRAEELLSFVDLEEKKNSPITSLSGGMRRRVVLARSLINDPKVIILDEPTTGLDIQSRHIFWDKLLELKKMGVSIILTTHHMDEVEKLADRLVIIHQGEIIEEGSPKKLTSKYGGRSLEDIFLLLTDSKVKTIEYNFN